MSDNFNVWVEHPLYDTPQRALGHAFLHAILEKRLTHGEEKMDLNGLPADVAKFVDDALASGKYPSAEALVCDALQCLQEHGRQQSMTPLADAVPPDAPPQSPDDYLRAIAQALRTGELGCARQLAMEGAERYPAHDELHKYAHVLALPTVRVVPASAASRASVKANNTWMK